VYINNRSTSSLPSSSLGTRLLHELKPFAINAGLKWIQNYKKNNRKRVWCRHPAA
jgi:hypothetical protein